ncbi:nucleoside deaminase [Ferruginibacter sp. HRS2-29]|uniref:nucleoside deaminase n=1 Tax=Ferruginibacter sp. HRS2-29 TaxID=2487334 RepID=UPI0020CCA035|nr:nucleoside deaminase [Ferruginibacter sp. HRS2-29]MCP9750455.1 nucleoside deaminase [Ferruginibacter sp. HRS2-29]
MNDEQYMRQALTEAQKAFEKDEVPIGAIVVLNNRIIARAHNQTELLTDSTAHAEILALTTAYNFLGSKYLPEATLYVTVEPCLMCSGALYWSKIGRVVFGAYDDKNGYRRVAGANNPFHPKTELVGGVLAEECGQLMKDFFRGKR